MSSKAITDQTPEQKAGDRPPGGPLAPVQLAGPSEMREDELALPRALGMIGAALVIFGGMALFFHLAGRAVRVSMGWAVLVLAVGMCGLLFHAAFDRDVQFRRLYGGFGALALLVGAALALYPHPAVGALFGWSVPCFVVALLFLLAFLRNEDDRLYRDLAQYGLGGAGLVMAAVGLIGGALRGDFLLSYGLALSLLGLLYVAAFVGSRGISDDLAYRGALGLAAAGAAVVIASVTIPFFRPEGFGFFASYGALLFTLGVIYLLVGAGQASDSALMVLTRREIGAFFYSPLAYLTLFGFVVLAWIAYSSFLNKLVEAGQPRAQQITEPIVSELFWDIFPVFTAVLAVPVLTMRLLSEEQRSGTLEVLLTAPVDESTVVLSKFIAALVTYLLMWLPFGLFLLAIPLSGGSSFDYRPMLSFAVALVATGAGFVSGGLFFSSLTRSQIASGVLTGTYMMFLTFVHFLGSARNTGEWSAIFQHASYLRLWFDSLDGILRLKYVLFHLSVAVMFLFLTVKVLESRKWR